MRTKLRKNRGFKNKKSGNQKIYLLGKTHCSRDRQGRVSVRRLGLVYLKKEPQRKKDNALNCIILFKFPYKLRIKLPREWGQTLPAFEPSAFSE